MLHLQCFQKPILRLLFNPPHHNLNSQVKAKKESAVLRVHGQPWKLIINQKEIHFKLEKRRSIISESQTELS
jgi:hypothetical protein